MPKYYVTETIFRELINLTFVKEETFPINKTIVHMFYGTSNLQYIIVFVIWKLLFINTAMI